MTIFLFGNPDVPEDSLPLQLQDALEQEFPEHTFIHVDPNEEWDIPEQMVIIDTVMGISDVQLFTDLTVFKKSPRVSLHDFDAYANLLLLQKIGKLKTCSIIGVPSGMKPEHALKDICSTLRANSL